MSKLLNTLTDVTIEKYERENGSQYLSFLGGTIEYNSDKAVVTKFRRSNGTTYLKYPDGSIKEVKPVPKQSTQHIRTRWVHESDVDDNTSEEINTGYLDDGTPNGYVEIKYVVNKYGKSLPVDKWEI